MQFDIITIFPHVFDSYVNESILKKAQQKGLISVRARNLRDYSEDRKHFKVDDSPYGGGPGMVLKVAPIYRAVTALRRHPERSAKRGVEGSQKRKTKERIRVILFSAKGKQFTQADARRYARYYDRLLMICGRYEGIDERVAKHIADEEVSIGPYILTGGEIPAMVIVDSVSRHIPGALGKQESLEEKRLLSTFNFQLSTVPLRVASYPVYTRPEIFSPKKGVYWRVPKVLLTGNHKKIEEWRKRALTSG